MNYTIKVKPMDTILARPHGWIGRAISWFTNGEFSHAGKILKFGGRTWVVDADPPVVRIMPLSSWLKTYTDAAIYRSVYYLLDEPKWREVEEQAEEFLFPMIGVREYSESTIARLAVRLPFGAVPEQDEIDHDEPVICSRLVSEADMAVIGIDPCEDRADWATTPQDLADSEDYLCVCEKLEII